MIISINYYRLLALGAFGLALALSVTGCSQSIPANPNPPNDPAGLGTPQQRLEALKSNNVMDPRLKARKMKILQDEVNGTNTAPGQH